MRVARKYERVLQLGAQQSCWTAAHDFDSMDVFLITEFRCKKMLDDKELACEDVWDTGDLECGELLLPLRRRVEALKAEGIIKLITRSPSAALDLLAWCRVTGHRMLKSNPPRFYIQRKED